MDSSLMLQDNSFLWIFALLILCGGGFGGFGFGNRGGTDAVQNDILYSSKFSDLGTSINKVGDGIASLGYSQLQQMDANTSSINGNITSEGRNIQAQLCAINSNIDNKFAQLEKSQLEQRIAEQSAQINQLQMAQMMCGVPKINNTAWGVYPYANNGCTGLATI